MEFREYLDLVSGQIRNRKARDKAVRWGTTLRIRRIFMRARA